MWMPKGIAHARLASRRGAVLRPTFPEHLWWLMLLILSMQLWCWNIYCGSKAFVSLWSKIFNRFLIANYVCMWLLRNKIEVRFFIFFLHHFDDSNLQLGIDLLPPIMIKVNNMVVSSWIDIQTYRLWRELNRRTSSNFICRRKKTKLFLSSLSKSCLLHLSSNKMQPIIHLSCDCPNIL